MGNPTTTTKGQQPEIAETRGHPKRHQGRSREGRRRTPIYSRNLDLIPRFILKTFIYIELFKN